MATIHQLFLDEGGGGQNCYDGKNSFCVVMPNVLYQHPLLKSIHVLEGTKALYACIAHIENRINKISEIYII